MKLLMTAHTLDEHGTHEPGEIVELADEHGEKYIAEGLALPVDAKAKPKGKVERAVKEQRETAAGAANEK